jgi:hypothetical protein
MQVMLQTTICDGLAFDSFAGLVTLATKEREGACSS